MCINVRNSNQIGQVFASNQQEHSLPQTTEKPKLLYNCLDFRTHSPVIYK